jgi:hypothetical protein
MASAAPGLAQERGKIFRKAVRTSERWGISDAFCDNSLSKNELRSIVQSAGESSLKRGTVLSDIAGNMSFVHDAVPVRPYD